MYSLVFTAGTMHSGEMIVVRWQCTRVFMSQKNNLIIKFSFYLHAYLAVIFKMPSNLIFLRYSYSTLRLIFYDKLHALIGLKRLLPDWSDEKSLQLQGV